MSLIPRDYCGVIFTVAFRYLSRFARNLLSPTRSSIGSVWSHHGIDAYFAFLSRHGLTISGGCDGLGSGAPEQLTAKASRRQYPPHVSSDAPEHCVVHPLASTAGDAVLSLLPQ